jgi:hypothetical protein
MIEFFQINITMTFSGIENYIVLFAKESCGAYCPPILAMVQYYGD